MRRKNWLPLLLIAFTSVCGGEHLTGPVTPSPAPTASVSVSLAAPSLTVGATTQATAANRDASGNVLSARQVTWTSTNPAVATVSANGLVTAEGAGTATITATSEGQSGSATLTVTLVPVSSVTVSLAAVSVTAGGTTQATATTKDASGTVLSGRVVTWASSSPSVATVNATTGLVSAVSAGSATITASSEGQSASATLSVTPVPVSSVTVSLAAAVLIVDGATQATVITKDAAGLVLSGRAVTWTSSNPAVATVSASGLVTALSVGSANITATSEGQSGSALLTVTLVPVSSVTVTLAAPVLSVGGATQATATTRDAAGNVLTGRTVTWMSGSPGVATVSAGGMVTAVGVGTATITATSEGQSGLARVTVTSGVTPTASVSVSLAATSLTVGGTTQATATNRDAAGNVLAGRAVTWTSSNPTIAIVAASGLVTAVGAGTVTITATSDGQSGSATLTVTAVIVPTASVSVSLAKAFQAVGGTTQATATNRDAAGNVLTGQAVTWTSNNPAVGTVSASGLVAAVGVGTATITATSDGQSGSNVLNVCQGPTSLAIGQTIAGTIQAGDCAVNNQSFDSTHPFNGPNSAVSVFYDLYTLDVPANTIATVTVNGGTPGVPVIVYAFTATGTYVAGRFDSAVPINNTSGTTVRYQVLVTTTVTPPGAYTLTATATAAAACPAATLLVTGQSATGTIQEGTCSLNTPLFSSSRNFNGSEPGGTYFYNVYSIDVAANTVATVTVLRGTLPFGAYLYAFTSTGAFVAGGSADGALAISNASGATVRYQVLVTTTGAGAAGNYTLFSTAAGSGACPAAAALTMGQAATGAIQAGGCTLSNPFFSSSRPFTGAESGGKYFYNLYTIDVAPNTVATVTATRGTLPPGVYIYAFSTTGAFVSGSSPDGTLTINNSPNVTGTTVRYQVLVTTSTAGVTGTYTLNSSAVVGTPCPAPGRSFLPLTSGIFAGDCSLSIPFFSSNRPFNGPELGGTYFYRLFTGILVFDNSVATFTVARGTLPFAAYVYAFTSTGVYVAGGGADVPLTLTNFGPSQSYNLLVTTSEPGATGTFTLNSTSAPLCPAGLALLVGQTRTGTIQTGNCSLTDPVFSSSRPFKGPEMGGTYFYNLLSTDVAANSVATLTIARGTLPPGAYLYAFLPSGVYVAGGSADGALTINNTGGATQNYYVLVTTTAPGATGTYTLSRGPQ